MLCTAHVAFLSCIVLTIFQRPTGILLTVGCFFFCAGSSLNYHVRYDAADCTYEQIVLYFASSSSWVCSSRRYYLCACPDRKHNVICILTIPVSMQSVSVHFLLICTRVPFVSVCVRCWNGWDNLGTSTAGRLNGFKSESLIIFTIVLFIMASCVPEIPLIAARYTVQHSPCRSPRFEFVRSRHLASRQEVPTWRRSTSEGRTTPYVKHDRNVKEEAERGG